jgi:hypothetical protein
MLYYLSLVLALVVGGRGIQLVPRTLDLLILKGVSLGPRHGYGILLRLGVIVTSSWPEPHVYKTGFP